MKKVAFLDRDGALIYEPQTDYLIDTIDKLQILSDVVEDLQELKRRGYSLVMVTNQDGVGTPAFPQKAFDVPQQEMLRIFARYDIYFDEVFVCPHVPADDCICRKPELGMVQEYLASTDIDYEQSFMYGDRATDREFATNMGVRFIRAITNQPCVLIKRLS